MITKIEINGFKALKKANLEFYTTKNIADKNKEVTRKHKLKNNNFMYTFNLAGIIGANATGKTSFLDAIFLYKMIIIGQFKISNTNNALVNKLCGLEKQAKEFIFEYLIDDVILRHKLNLDSEFNIIAEELLILESNNRNEKEWKPIFLNDKDYSLLWRIAEISRYENHETFNLDPYFIKLINKIFHDILTIAFFDNNNFGLAEHYNYSRSLKQDLKILLKTEESKIKKESLELLKSLIIAIDPKVINFKYDDFKDDIIILIRDNNKIIEVPFEHISDGTKRFIYLMLPIFMKKNQTNFYLIDEIENSFHPKIVGTILRLFYYNQNNVNNSQFIFTTHNPYIFDLVDLHNSCINISFYDSERNFEKLSNFEESSLKRNDKSFSKKYVLEVINSHPDSNNINDIYDNFIDEKFYERI